MKRFLGPRSGVTAGAVLGQGSDLSKHDECGWAVGPVLGLGNDATQQAQLAGS